VFSPGAFAGATVTFVICGAIASLYGPLLVTFAGRFHVSLPTAGAVLSVHFVGALCGVPLAWVALRRFPSNAVLSASVALLALGVAGAAAARGFGQLLAAVVVIGLGFGGTDFSLNTLLVRTAAAGRAHRLSVANGGYSLGSVIGPLLLIVAGPQRYRLVFAAVACSALALTVSARGVDAPPAPAVAHTDRHPRRRSLLGCFVVAYVLYVATESAAAGWIAPQLHRVGYSQAAGAAVTAGFWLCLAVGRFLAGPAQRLMSDRRLVMVGLAATTALALAASADPVAPVAYALAGLSLALVYPMGLIWFSTLNPGDNDGLAILIFTMMAGGVLGPAVTGAAVAVLGVHAVPVCIAGFAAADLAAFAAARRFRPVLAPAPAARAVTPAPGT
jgi:fucose permease